MTHSRHVENYLKEILGLQDGTDRAVSTNSIAKAINVQAASVTDMLKKLSAEGLVSYEPYQGARLTNKGHEIAKSILRKHRLWETFLVSKLGFDWAEVHDIAEQLEHIKSDVLVDKLDDFLGHPKFDPHGEPIPNKIGQWNVSGIVRLTEIEVGESVKLTGVKEDSSEFLRLLDELGLKLNDTIDVEKKLDFDNSLRIKLDGESFNISSEVASNLMVRKS